ncbi:hypothetical protein [Halosimplex sp. J119]
MLSAIRVLWYVITGRVRMPRGRVGTVIETDEGQQFTIYRETEVTTPASDRSDAAAVLAFRFHLWFMPAPFVPFAVRVFEPLSILTTPFFAGLTGFRTKLWLFDHATGDYLGIYQWETAAGAQRYARALGSLMRFVSNRDSISYVVVDDTTLDRYLAPRSIAR